MTQPVTPSYIIAHLANCRQVTGVLLFALYPHSTPKPFFSTTHYLLLEIILSQLKRDCSPLLLKPSKAHPLGGAALCLAWPVVHGAVCLPTASLFISYVPCCCSLAPLELLQPITHPGLCYPDVRRPFTQTFLSHLCLCSPPHPPWLREPGLTSLARYTAQPWPFPTIVRPHVCGDSGIAVAPSSAYSQGEHGLIFVFKIYLLLI